MVGNILTSLEVVNPKNLSSLSDKLRYLIRGRLWLQILIAMALGIGTGLMLSPETGWVSKNSALVIGEWIALPGQVFLAMIQMIVVPLILASIIRGIAAASDVQQLKSTGLWLSIYFVATTVIAVIIGISLGLTLKPGTYVGSNSIHARAGAEARAIEETAVQAAAKNGDIHIEDVPSRLTGLLPKNPISSIVEGDMLQIVIFSIILGIGLLSLPAQSAKPLLELFGSVQEVCMAVVAAVMTFAPLAVFGLLTQAMIKTGPGVLAGLGMYAGSVVLGMFILLVFYALVVAMLARHDPFNFVRAIREPFLLGFSTNSSAATMPVTVRCAEQELNVRPSIAQLIVPLGATVNMGGTALYQGLATVFMAQMFHIELPLSALIALVATALGASIGTPAVPGVGIIVLATVLSSVGVPLTGLALIVGLDRILERFRASLNITGDLAACLVLDRFMPARQSKQEELVTTEQLNELREVRQEDVIVRH